MVQMLHKFAAGMRAHNVRQHAGDMGLVTWGQMFTPHYFYLKPSVLHERISAMLDTPERGKRVAIVAPRDSAKSTFLTFAQPLRDVCQQREAYVILAADTQSQARKYLDAIKNELETNARLAEAYPFACGKGAVWNVDGITTANGVRVEAISTGMKMRGRKQREDRPTAIYIDDPEGDDATHSPVIRSRVWDWLTKAVFKAGSPDTNVFVASTRVHRECAIARLAVLPRWRAIEYASIMDWPKDMERWYAWRDVLCKLGDPESEGKARAYFKTNRKSMERGARVLWADREPLYDLMEMWAEDPTSFQSEKQNNPIDPATCEWNDTYFDYEGFWFDAWPNRDMFDVLVCAVDPSKGKDAKKGDYSAIVTLGRDNQGTLWVECFMRRMPTDHIVDECMEYTRTHRPDAFAVEVNQFQELMGKDMVRASKERGILFPYTTIENMVKKPIRIRRLGPFMGRHDIRYRSTPGTVMMVNQMRDFPNGDHDDGPDAFEMALRTSIEVYNGRVGPGDGLGNILNVA